MANHEAWAVGVHLDESYVEELFRARYPEMVRLAGLLGADDPEDIAQEAFTRLMNKEPDLGDARAALAYADVLSEHVSFEVECVDRMYLNVYVPQLQYATGLVSYIHRQLGMPVASTAALAPVGEAFSRSVRSFAASCGIPWVDFAKGQRKDDVALEFLAGFTGTEGVLFIGRAQEKVPLFDPQAPPGRWQLLPVDRRGDRGGQPVLLLLRR